MKQHILFKLWTDEDIKGWEKIKCKKESGYFKGCNNISIYYENLLLKMRRVALS